MHLLQASYILKNRWRNLDSMQAIHIATTCSIAPTLTKLFIYAKVWFQVSENLVESSQFLKQTAQVPPYLDSKMLEQHVKAIIIIDDF